MSDEIEVSLDGLSVTIGIPVYNPIPHRTVMSLCGTVQELTKHKIKHNISMHVCGIITMGRSNVLADFLQSGTQKLFWVDADMVWDPQDVMKLLAMSTEVDVVAAAYPAKVEGPATYYANFDAERKIGPFGLHEVKGLGLGFTVVDRKVCQELSDRAPMVKDEIANRSSAQVFRTDATADGHFRGEDMAFFADIRDLGYTVWCDPTIELGHIGPREWRGRLSDAFIK